MVAMLNRQFSPSVKPLGVAGRIPAKAHASNRNRRLDVASAFLLNQAARPAKNQPSESKRRLGALVGALRSRNRLDCAKFTTSLLHRGNF